MIQTSMNFNLPVVVTTSRKSLILQHVKLNDFFFDLSRPVTSSILAQSFPETVIQDAQIQVSEKAIFNLCLIIAL